jgi:hypothetical protein
MSPLIQTALAVPVETPPPFEVGSPTIHVHLTGSPAADVDPYDLETNRLVLESSKVVTERETDFETYKAAAKAAKEAFEDAVEDLRKLIRKRNDDKNATKGTLFEEPREPRRGTCTENDGQTLPIDADLWKRYPITAERWERWGVTEKDVEKLNAGESKKHGTNPIITLGDLTRFICPDPSNPGFARALRDIKGFGDAACERWAQAETKFWAWWGAEGESEFAREMGVNEGGDDGIQGEPGNGSEDPSNDDLDSIDAEPRPELDPDEDPEFQVPDHYPGSRRKKAAE